MLKSRAGNSLILFPSFRVLQIIFVFFFLIKCIVLFTSSHDVIEELKFSMPHHEEKKDKNDEKAPVDLRTRTGGAYIPPAKLKLLQDQIADKGSEQYQRINWERLKKKIHRQVLHYVFTFVC